MRLLKRFRREAAGLAAVEFALVLPIAVAMLFGEFVLGEALSISRKVSIAARTVGDLVARNGSIYERAADDDHERLHADRRALTAIPA